MAGAVVEEVADAAGGRTVEALKEHLTDAARRSWLERELATAWESRPQDPGVDAAAAVARAAEALEACGARAGWGTPPCTRP